MKKALGQYGPPGVADSTSGSAPAKEEDDDDIDLFGSDDEVRSNNMAAADVITWSVMS